MSAPDLDRTLGEGPLVLTGAGGWFGRALLARVAAERSAGRPAPAVVTALVANPGEVGLVLEVLPEARVHVGDIADADVVARLLRSGAGSLVVHAAGVIHPHTVADFTRVNVGGTRTLLAAAATAGVRRLVHLSSNSAFGVNPAPTDLFRQEEPYLPYLGYGESKAAAERLVRAAHESGAVETVVVRPPWFYGPWQPERQTRFFTMVRRGRFPLLGDGSQRRSMVYVDNLVDGVARAAGVPEAAGGAFWVADARPYPMREVVDTVRAVLREEGYTVASRQPHLPALIGRVAERVDRAVQSTGRYQQAVHVLGEMDKTIACDISRTTRVLGYRPRVELAEGMRRSVRWCRSRGIEL